MRTQKFSLTSRAKSFRFAFQGLHQFFSTQHNAIIHAVATGVAVSLSVILKISPAKLLFIVVAIGLVWMAELFNTAIEQLCDMICPQRHPQIKFIKDVSAAAVLVTAIIAAITGCLIFIPELL